MAIDNFYQEFQNDFMNLVLPCHEVKKIQKFVHFREYL